MFTLVYGLLCACMCAGVYVHTKRSSYAHVTLGDRRLGLRILLASPGWSFSLEGADAAIELLASCVFEFLRGLQGLDVAHNVLVGSGGARVVVFPRRITNQQGTDVTRLQVAGHEALGCAFGYV